MSTLAEIERAIEALPKDQFEALSDWFAQRREAAADAEFERAIDEGAFDAMAERAVRDHAAGKSRPLDELVDGS
jgi:hypothetical protein